MKAASVTGGVLFVSLMAFTGVAALQVRRAELDTAQATFTSVTEGIPPQISERMGTLVALLRGGTALFTATDRVDREELHNWVRRLRLDDEYPALLGIGYTARVPRAEVPEVVARVREEVPEFHAWPASTGPDVHMILHVEPVEQNRSAFGFDMHIEARRAAAMDRARDTGLPSLSAPVTLVQEPISERETPGLLLYVPVYRDVDEPRTIEERRASLRGFVYAPIRVPDLFPWLLAGVDHPGLAFTVADDGVVFHRGGDAGPDPFTRTTRIDALGRTWELQVAGARAAFAPGTSQALPVLVGGALLSLAAAVAAFLLSRSHRSLAAALAEVQRAKAIVATSEAEAMASEAVLRALFASLPQILFTADAEGRVVRVNERWTAVTGRPSADALGRGWLVAVADADRDRVAEAWEHAVQTGEPLSAELRLATVDRGERWTLFQARPGAGVDEHVWSASFTDVHDTRLVEEHAREAQRLEAIGILAGGVAHDFNNILTAISGYGSLARRAVGPDHEAAPMLDQIIGAVKRAADLTRQLLAYAGKGRVATRRVDLGQVVHEVVGLLRASVPRSTEVTVDVAPGLVVEADPGQVHQIVLNLVMNAAEAQGDRSGRIRLVGEARKLDAEALESVRADWRVEPGTFAMIEVTDEGEGMDEATLAHLFDPFFTTRFAGRGLGLAAVYGIVRAYRGAFQVWSTPGAGTTFRVFLPLAPTRAAIPATPAVTADPGARWRGLVLVVDDDATILGVARAALEARGFRVAAAADGATALALATREQPGLALVDLTMPGLSGADTIAALRRDAPELNVLVMTGHGEDETVRRLRGIPIQGVLHKPFSAEELEAAVATAAPAPVMAGV